MRVDENVQYDASQSFIEALREINARPRCELRDGELRTVSETDGNAEVVPNQVPKTPV